MVCYTAWAGLIFSQDHLTILHWTDREGLSSNKVSCICRGSDGFVWIGTNNGLNKFDGYSIKPFYSSNKKQFRISSNLIYDIKEGTDGKIWVATDKGLNRIDPNNNTNTIFDQSTIAQIALPNTSIRTILPDSAGMWLGCEARDLAYWDFKTQRISTFPFREYAFDLFPILRYKLLYISQIEKITNGVYLLDSNVGLFLFDHKNKSFQCLDNYLGLPFVRSFSLNRSLYHRSVQNTIASYEANNQTFKRIAVGAKNAAFDEKPFVNSIVPVNDSVHWLLTDRGLFLLHLASGFVEKTNAAQYPTGPLNTFFKEKNGNIWVGGFDGLWLVKHDQHPFIEEKFVKNPRLYTHNLLNYVLEDQATHIRYYPENYGNVLYRQTPAKVGDKVTFDDELRLITQTNDHSLWLAVGTTIKRQKIGAQTFSNFPIPNSVFDPQKKFRFTDVKQDGQGNLWFATNRDGLAVYQLKSGTWWKPGPQDSFISNSITKIEFSATSPTAWIASDDYGLWNFDPATSKFKLYPPTETHASSAINSYVITDICKDGSGNFFFATLDGGCSSYDQVQKKFNHYTTNEGLSSNLVYSLIADNQNRIWLATDRGIDCFDPTTKEVSHFDEKYFGTDFDKELTINKLPAGMIAFGTKLGYIQFHPDSLLKRTNPQVLVSSFKVLDREMIDSIDLSQEIILSWLDNLITIELATDQPSFDGKTSFAYRLIDMAATWNKIDKGNILTLSYLPYGTHELWIKVCENGMESNQILKVRLKIRPPFYKTIWFYFGIILALSSLLYFYIRLKIKQVSREALIRNDYNQQLANIEMSALRAQMNPHFIFNCLNSINRFILVHDTEAASAYLTKFSRLIRLILDSSRAEYISLEKELQALSLYVEMESMRFQDSFQFSLQVGAGIATEAVLIPPMLVQPFVENAIWHGLMQAPPELVKRLSIHITQPDNGCTIIEITDNGIGRARAKALQSKSLSRQKSYGISLSQERLSLMNRAKNKNSTIRVDDLHDENGEVKGTKVTITIENDESNIGR